jgi:hypothetical protein
MMADASRKVISGRIDGGFLAAIFRLDAIVSGHGPLHQRVAEIAANEDEAVLALALDGRQEGLHHHGVRHVRDGAAPLQAVLAVRAGADLALEDEVVRSRASSKAAAALAASALSSQRVGMIRAPRASRSRR